MNIAKKNKSPKMKSNYEENSSLVQDTRGLSTVEYLILLVVIAVAGITVWKNVGKSISDKATSSKGHIDSLSSE